MFSSAARSLAVVRCIGTTVVARNNGAKAALISSATSRQQTPKLLGARTFATFLPENEVTDRIIQVVKNFDKVDPSKVVPSSKFGEDLGLDSLDSVEVVMAIEDEFAIEIPDAEADKISSIEDAVSYITAHPMAK